MKKLFSYLHKFCFMSPEQKAIIKNRTEDLAAKLGVNPYCVRHEFKRGGFTALIITAAILAIIASASIR